LIEDALVKHNAPVKARSAFGNSRLRLIIRIGNAFQFLDEAKRLNVTRSSALRFQPLAGIGTLRNVTQTSPLASAND